MARGGDWRVKPASALSVPSVRQTRQPTRTFLKDAALALLAALGDAAVYMLAYRLYEGRWSGSQELARTHE